MSRRLPLHKDEDLSVKLGDLGNDYLWDAIGEQVDVFEKAPATEPLSYEAWLDRLEGMLQRARALSADPSSGERDASTYRSPRERALLEIAAAGVSSFLSEQNEVTDKEEQEEAVDRAQSEEDERHRTAWLAECQAEYAAAKREGRPIRDKYKPFDFSSLLGRDVQ